MNLAAELQSTCQVKRRAGNCRDTTTAKGLPRPSNGDFITPPWRSTAWEVHPVVKIEAIE